MYCLSDVYEKNIGSIQPTFTGFTTYIFLNNVGSLIV